MIEKGDGRKGESRWHFFVSCNDFQEVYWNNIKREQWERTEALDDLQMEPGVLSCLLFWCKRSHRCHHVACRFHLAQATFYETVIKIGFEKHNNNITHGNSCLATPSARQQHEMIVNLTQQLALWHSAWTAHQILEAAELKKTACCNAPLSDTCSACCC